VRVLAPAIRVAVVAALLSPACASTRSPLDRELAGVADAGFRAVGRPVVVVIRENETPEVRAAACHARHCKRERDVLPTPDGSLPGDYFVLKKLEVSGSAAVFGGLLGPIPPQKPGLRIDACGTTLEIRLVRTPEGAWEPTETTATGC